MGDLDGVTMQDQVVNELKGPYFPFNRREHYPRQLKVDFRKLTRKTLLSYTDHHDLHVRPDSTHEELAVATARHFAMWRVNEESIMRSFITRMTVSTKHGLGDDVKGADRKRKHMEKPLDPPLPGSLERREQQRLPKRQRHHGLRSSTRQGYGYGEKGTIGNKKKGDDEEENKCGERKGREGVHPPLSKRHGEEALKSNRLPRYVTRASGIAPTVIPADDRSSSDDTELDEGETVAAYMDRSWILARVVRTMRRGQYNRRQVELQDEDDASHVFVLPLSDVIQLRDISSDVQKGDKIMAVFPDTTMFYCATIATDTPQMENSKMMILVKFDDDEDEHGETLLRRVPVEHVILEDELPQRGIRKNRQGNKVGTTYADMIEHALSNLKDGRGTLANICGIIEKDFRDVLNWRIDNDIRKTPVWRSSVRKILFSNSRFSHRSNRPQQGYIFFMALNGTK